MFDLVLCCINDDLWDRIICVRWGGFHSIDCDWCNWFLSFFLHWSVISALLDCWFTTSLVIIITSATFHVSVNISKRSFLVKSKKRRKNWNDSLHFWTNWTICTVWKRSGIYLYLDISRSFFFTFYPSRKEFYFRKTQQVWECFPVKVYFA